jgi:SAM-dependent methyltransferase
MPSKTQSLKMRIFPTSHRLLLERILRAEIPKAQGKVLVLGTGYDPYGHLIPDGCDVTRTDIEDDYDIDMVADAHDLPFDDDSFDTIIAIEVFEHLQYPHKAAEEVRRVLKPGGKAMVSTPFLFRVHGDPYDFTRFTKRGLQTHFEKFSKTSIEGYGNRIHVIWDILTTSFRYAALGMCLNHVLAKLWPRANSSDSPSGFFLTATK